MYNITPMGGAQFMFPDCDASKYLGYLWIYLNNGQWYAQVKLKDGAPGMTEKQLADQVLDAVNFYAYDPVKREAASFWVDKTLVGKFLRGDLVKLTQKPDISHRK